ncbi:myosin-like protein [Achlya hypogyna]|uniref:Myosin-like protein n=1 Tax=Achlya hypogyna TaxID=1202772 RepID=A0A1V9YV40_ACHHY|nr:myosin-like protein [Achlya hypogyna]
MDTVEAVAALLNTAPGALKVTLCQRKMTAGGETYMIPLNADQAADLRDAFAKGMYSHLFDWLVGRINRAICSTKNVATHIGLLDIFGFESFDHNGFEQLCINYANEKLQQKFNSDIFKTVQKEYVEEGIPLDLVTFEDNQPILDLIEGKLGIVDLLNETCLQPKGTDSMFVNKVHEAFASHKSIDRVRMDPMQFKIIHYAGDVTYDGTGFLDKNKDTLPSDLLELLASSQSSFIRDVFPELAPKATSTKPKSAPRRQGFLVGNTIAGSFRKQLGELMEQIAKTATQYVRCIKPNANKSATEFDRRMVVDQLRCAGVIAAIRISRAAFPNRLTLKEFATRFAIICPSKLRTASPEAMVLGLLQLLLPETTSAKNALFAIGRTKVYFSSGLLQRLEDRRNELLREFAALIQRNVRMFACRQRYQRLRRAAVLVQAHSRAWLVGVQQRRWYTTLQRGVLRAQAQSRGRAQRHRFRALVEAERARKEAERLRALAAAEAQAQLDRAAKLQATAEPVKAWVDDGSDDEVPPSPRPTYHESLIDNSGNAELLDRVTQAEALALEAREAAEGAMALNEFLQRENKQLKQKLAQNVQEYADAELKEENERLKHELAVLQSKLARSEEVALVSAKVVDSRISFREGRQFVEYKLQIETNSRGTLFVWHRYSTFRNLATTLQSKNGYRKKDIPELPNKQLFGNFSEKIIQERVAKLNEFLEAATRAEYLQWGIRVDQDTCVYKRRVKHGTTSTSRDTASTSRDTVSIANFRASSSSFGDEKDAPRQSFVSRFSLKRNKSNVQS